MINPSGQSYCHQETITPCLESECSNMWLRTFPDADWIELEVATVNRF